MKKLVLIAGLLFVSVAFSQSEAFSNDNTPVQDITFKNGLYFQKDVAYTGKYIVYFSTMASRALQSGGVLGRLKILFFRREVF